MLAADITDRLPAEDEARIAEAVRLFDEADRLGKIAADHRYLRDEHDVAAERFFEESQARRGQALEILRGIKGKHF